MEKRGKWRYGLPLLALIALLGLLAVPASRWLVRAQFMNGFFSPQEYAWTSQVLGIRPDNVPAADKSVIRGQLFAAVARRPGEYKYELAATILMPDSAEKWKSQDVIAALRSLEERYPQEPSLYAHILRFGSMGELRIGRDEEQAQVTDRPYDRNTPPVTVDTARLWEYIETAEKGIELEPDNAYFYAMRAIAQFGLHQDKAALEDIHRAAGCSRYEDYSSDEAEARLILLREAFGEQSALIEIAQSASILFPHYAKLRSAARMAIYDAIEAEQAGNVEEGIAIREDVMRFGSLLRRQSRSYIGTLVGIAITGVGRTRPGGEYLGAETEPANAFRNEGTEAEKRLEEKAQRKLELFTAFLNQHERSDLAVWTRNEYAIGNEVKAIGTAGLENHVFDTQQILRLAGLWIAGMLILSNAVWILLFSALAFLLMRRKAASGRLSGLIFAGLFVAAMVFTFASQPLAGHFGSMLTALNGMMDSQWESGYSEALKVVTFAGAMAIPILMLITASIVSLFCRVPVSLGVLRVFRGLGLPVACVLFLLYGAVTPMTVREEMRVKQELRQLIQHDGHYLAKQAGRAWPDK